MVKMVKNGNIAPEKSDPECPFECGGGCNCYLGNAQIEVASFKKGLPLDLSDKVIPKKPSEENAAEIPAGVGQVTLNLWRGRPQSPKRVKKARNDMDMPKEQEAGAGEAAIEEDQDNLHWTRPFMRFLKKD